MLLLKNIMWRKFASHRKVPIRRADVGWQWRE